jgi:hypothetical protein
MIENYSEKFLSRGKFVFVPNEHCDKRGERLLAFGKTVPLPKYFYHYLPGGHVEALHQHLRSSHFFRIDLSNFFYSIGRNRVARVLRQYGFPGNARTYAEWSTVRNPCRGGPSYALPIGFRQSPILASLALYNSAVASAVEDALHRGVFVSVYFDDLIGSSTDVHELTVTYNGILDACVQANLVANPTKLMPPSPAIVAFNCNLTHGTAKVTEARIDKYLAEDADSMASLSAFIEYCDRVAAKNFA